MQLGPIEPHPSILIIALLAMLVGLGGLIIPIFPGLVVIWGAALGYGISQGFGQKGWIVFAFMTLLMITGSVIDNVIMGKRGHAEGASWWDLAAAWAAGVAGSLLVPPFGGVPASILAVFIIEWVRRGDWRLAITVTRSVAVGCGWAYVIRLGMGLLMIGLFIFWAAF